MFFFLCRTEADWAYYFTDTAPSASSHFRCLLESALVEGHMHEFNENSSYFRQQKPNPMKSLLNNDGSSFPKLIKSARDLWSLYRLDEFEDGWTIVNRLATTVALTTAAICGIILHVLLVALTTLSKYYYQQKCGAFLKRIQNVEYCLHAKYNYSTDSAEE